VDKSANSSSLFPSTGHVLFPVVVCLLIALSVTGLLLQVMDGFSQNFQNYRLIGFFDVKRSFSFENNMKIVVGETDLACVSIYLQSKNYKKTSNMG